MAIPDEPLTRTEQYLSRTATGGGTIPDEPLTRVEMYLNKIATGSGNTPDEPLTRVEMYLDEIAENGGGGGGSTIELLASGTYALASVATTTDIPVSFTGTAKCLVVKKRSVTPDLGQMLVFSSTVVPEEAEELYEVVTALGYGYFRHANGTTGTDLKCYSGVPFVELINNNTALRLNQYSNNFRIQPDDYDWFIYGEAAT